ncbi:MAG: hypothetical protein R3F59_20185 [Myxococcota bacterium]
MRVGRLMIAGLALALAGCEPMPPSGRPLEPAPVAAPAPSGSTAPRPSAPPSAEDREIFSGDHVPERPGGPTGPVALDANGEALPVPTSPAPEAVAPPSAPSSPAAGPVLVWDPTLPLPDSSFGVQVMGIMADQFPPHAALALPDGRKVVVQAGTMLPDAGIVVLAIGRNGVRIAQITPSGYQANVVTQTIGVPSAREPAEP